MADKEKRYTENLQKCRANIKKTKGLIAYHKDMLKKLEKKEAALSEKLEKVKMTALCNLIHQGGYDIDSIREAVSLGDFSDVISDKSVMEETTITSSGSSEITEKTNGGNVNV